MFAIPTSGIGGREILGQLLRRTVGPSPMPSDYLSERRFRQRPGWRNLAADLTYLDPYADGSFGVFNKVGAMARAAGLTVREPFLDRDVADWILQLPLPDQFRGSRLQALASRAKTKHLLKHGLAPQLLPRKVIKKRKGGFTPPLSA